MTVAFVWSARWWRVWVHLGVTVFMSVKREGILSRVGLNLSV